MLSDLYLEIHWWWLRLACTVQHGYYKQKSHLKITIRYDKPIKWGKFSRYSVFSTFSPDYCSLCVQWGSHSQHTQGIFTHLNELVSIAWFSPSSLSPYQWIPINTALCKHSVFEGGAQILCLACQFPCLHPAMDPYPSYTSPQPQELQHIFFFTLRNSCQRL